MYLFSLPTIARSLQTLSSTTGYILFLLCVVLCYVFRAWVHCAICSKYLTADIVHCSLWIFPLVSTILKCHQEKSVSYCQEWDSQLTSLLKFLYGNESVCSDGRDLTRE
ncbi:hypothetical protein BJ138DRAFT_817917 [Hygrophoropsis aurantiaca]|uniref:Uncharacterized protein n=1 Tax=Hygrophoropsis aurantiaca TaxID=72124 RepID=A0ACB8AG89_9AGAM|nr:hypothetical protein BJ138DRAFT_817917 [Hygrophoropsis aurantiaca]